MFLPLTNASGGAVTVNVSAVVSIRPDALTGHIHVRLIDGELLELDNGQGQRLLDAVGQGPKTDDSVHIQEEGSATCKG